MNSIKTALLSFLVLILGILIGLQIAPAVLPQPETPAPAAIGSEKEAMNNGSRDEGKADAEQPEELTRDYLAQVLANADPGQRRQVLNDPEQFRQFVEREAVNHSLLAAARANRLHENDDIRFLMHRAGHNVLRDQYLNQLMREQFPADFPTDGQVRQFYEDNLERFRTDERVQVWQVFLEAPAEAGPEQAADIEKQARDLLGRIRDNKLTLAAAAVEHSDHRASRQNDGYMGLVKTGDLKPAIAEGLAGLNAGEYGLVRSDDGWHILRKGRTMDARTLSFEEVRQQARQLLVREVRRQFHQAVGREAGKSYPFMPDEARIEQWRQQLRESVGASGTEETG